MKILLRAALLIFLFCAFQEPQFMRIKSIPVTASQLTTDNMSNIYLMSADVLQKYDPSGTAIKSYSNKSLGKITAVDASNPLKLVLFYRNFLQIVFLDNTLSQNGDPVSIESLGYPQTQLVCSSHDNGIWIYNQQNFELIRFDQNLQVSNQTGNLVQQLGMDIKPSYMIEYNNRLYVNNPSTGILVFDVFGTYYKTIPIKNNSGFQFKEDEILFYQNNKLNSFNTVTLQLHSSVLPDSTAISARLVRDKLYVLQKDTLSIYTIK